VFRVLLWHHFENFSGPDSAELQRNCDELGYFIVVFALQLLKSWPELDLLVSVDQVGTDLWK